MLDEYHLKIIFINFSITPSHPTHIPIITTPIINKIIHIHIQSFINQALPLNPIDGNTVGDIVGGFDPLHPLSSADIFMMHQNDTDGLRLVPCIPVRLSHELSTSSHVNWLPQDYLGSIRLHGMIVATVDQNHQQCHQQYYHQSDIKAMPD